MNILIVKTSSMGDIIHCFPIVTDILHHYPQAQIDWVIEESFADIVRLHPNIHRVIPVAIRRWRKNLCSAGTRREFIQFKHALQQTHYDLIIDMQSLIKSALLARLAVGIRHGQNFKTARESLAACFYQHKHHVSRQQHAVMQNRALLAKILGNLPPTNTPDYGLNITHLGNPPHITYPASPFILALHGTSRDSKLWSIESWQTIGQALWQKGYTLALPWSNSAEQARANKIAQVVDNAIVLPKHTLTELAYLISAASAVIGVDTGLMHLAVALNKPTIAIYTDTFPALNGALAGLGGMAINLGEKHKTPTPDDVLQAFSRFSLN